MKEKTRILFLCTGNSCRSQKAKVWIRHLKGDLFDAYSDLPDEEMCSVTAEDFLSKKMQTGGITYDLGSINLYNYNYRSQSGPYIYTTSPAGDAKHDEFWSASNRLYLVGTGLSGDVIREVKMEDGVKLTVVVKE